MKPEMTSARVWLLGFFLLSVLGIAPVPSNLSPQEGIDIEVFVRSGCPHCGAAKIFLEKLQKEQPHLRMLISDVGEDPKALDRLQALAKKYGVSFGNIRKIVKGVTWGWLEE